VEFGDCSASGIECRRFDADRPMVGCMADDIFEHPRLVAIYDALDPDRSDLDVYAAIADELGARRVLDVGCGTGTFALLLADRGLEVTGVDPAGGSSSRPVTRRTARGRSGTARSPTAAPRSRASARSSAGLAWLRCADRW